MLAVNHGSGAAGRPEEVVLVSGKVAIDLLQREKPGVLLEQERDASRPLSVFSGRCQWVFGHIRGYDHSHPVLILPRQPVALALQSQGGGDAGRLHLHCAAFLEGALPIDLLQHAYDIGAHGLGLISRGLRSHIDLSDLLRLQAAAPHQEQKGHGGHGGGILMGIGNGHPLYAYSLDQLARIYAPAAGGLALQGQIEPGHIDGQVVNPHCRGIILRHNSSCSRTASPFQGNAG